MLKPQARPPPSVGHFTREAADHPPCIRHCGVLGYHPTVDDCLIAQREAIAALQARGRRPMPEPLGPDVDPPGRLRVFTPVVTPITAAPIAPRPPLTRVVRTGPKVKRVMTDRATKAAIVDRMFKARDGEIMLVARAAGTAFGVNVHTIVASWRQWARERDPV